MEEKQHNIFLNLKAPPKSLMKCMVREISKMCSVGVPIGKVLENIDLGYAFLQ